MRYRPANPPTGITGVLAQYLGQEFNRIRARFDELTEFLTEFFIGSVTNFVWKGYGGIANSTTSTFPNFSTGWQLVDGFDVGVVATPYDVTQNPASDSISVDREGIWSVNILVNWSHNELNQGRTTTLQLYNQTAAVALLTYTLATARNVSSTLFAVTALVEVNPVNVGDTLILRLGNGSSYTSNEWLNLEFSAVHNSENKDIQAPE